MDKIRTVSGSGPVYVDSNPVGHCAFEINVYKDTEGHVRGQGHVMGDSLVLGKMSAGQRVEIADAEQGHRFGIYPAEWSPGERRIDVETGADIWNPSYDAG